MLGESGAWAAAPGAPLPKANPLSKPKVTEDLCFQPQGPQRANLFIAEKKHRKNITSYKGFFLWYLSVDVSVTNNNGKFERFCVLAFVWPSKMGGCIKMGSFDIDIYI
jgi:hypothetical protein